jgi:glutaredoxin
VEPGLTLYVRAGCPLCDEAEELLDQLGIAARRQDVDLHPGLRALWGERVPVLLHGRTIVAQGHFDPDELVRRFT